LVEKTTIQEKSTLALLLGEIVHFRSFSKMHLTIYDSGILHFFIKDGEILNEGDYKQMSDWLKSIGNKKYLFLIEAGLKSEVNDDFIKSSAEDNAHTIADAIIIKSMAQRMIANFYIKFNKPVNPTQIFPDAESAAFWLMSNFARFN
jgi:hypothetical protein